MLNRNAPVPIAVVGALCTGAHAITIIDNSGVAANPLTPHPLSTHHAHAESNFLSVIVRQSAHSYRAHRQCHSAKK